MKFKLTESINEDELQVRLQEDYEEEQSILSQVREILSKEEFEEEEKLNGIAFHKDYDKDGYIFHAQFYVDTTTYEYSAYISTDDDNNVSNFSIRGNKNNILDALSKLMYQLKGDIRYGE